MTDGEWGRNGGGEVSKREVHRYWEDRALQAERRASEARAEVRALEQKRLELNVEIGERDAEIERLRSALQRLRNEAAGMVGMSGFREFAGNTNANVLEQRIEDAEALLLTKNTAQCDGNHRGPRCADPECWQDEGPAP